MNETHIAQWIVGVIVKPCKEYCPKCGSDDVYRRFIAKGEAVPYEGAATMIANFVYGNATTGGHPVIICTTIAGAVDSRGKDSRLRDTK